MSLIRNTSRLLSVAIALGATVVTVGLATAQVAPSTGVLSIDTPSDGDVVNNGDLVYIGGWAIGPIGNAVGLRVQAFLDGPPGRGAFLGRATYGAPRHDVAVAAGRPDWANSGFGLSWRPRDLAVGNHTIHVQAESGNLRWEQTVTVRATQALTGRRTCSFVSPCLINLDPTSSEWDTGGPGVLIQNDEDFFVR